MMNKYSYCRNNPLIFIDPTGLVSKPLEKCELRGWYGDNWKPDSSKFGPVRTDDKGQPKYHQGNDYAAPVGTPVNSITDGEVVTIEENHVDFGKYVDVKATINGEEVFERYAHLSEIEVKVGDKIKEGDKIGKTGKTGNASNLKTKEEHLHLEINKKQAPGTGEDGSKNRIDPETVITPDEAKKEDQQ